MKQPELELGHQSIYRDASRLRVLLGGMSVPASGVSSAWYRIWLVHVDGSDPDDYDVTDAGLAAANAAASSGDDILIPPYASFTSNYTITAGVAFIGQSPYATKFTGQITLGAGSYIKDCGINRSGSSTGTNVGVVGPGSGKGYIIGCSVIVDQNGAGNAVGLQMGAGEIDSRESYFYGDAASGTGYGITGDGGACNLSAGCWVRGTTALSDGSDIFGINFDNYIKVLDSGGNLVEIYPPTEQGVIDAMTAAGSGDEVDFPPVSISLTSGITVSASVGVRNGVLSFSGFAGTAVTLSAGSDMLRMNINYDATGEANATGVLATNVDNVTMDSCSIFVEKGTGTLKAISCSGDDPDVRSYLGGVAAWADGGTNTIGIELLGDGAISISDTSAKATGASGTNYAISVVSNAEADEVRIQHTRCRAEDTNSYGLYTDGYALVEHCNLVGGTAGILDTAGATTRFYSSKWGSFTPNGTVTYLFGDRGAYSVEDYHANDIEASAMTRHMPSPGTNNNVPVDDGTNWVSTPLSSIDIGDLGTRWEPLTNGDKDSPDLMYNNGDVLMNKEYM